MTTEEFRLTIVPRRQETRILMTEGPDDVLVARLGPATSAHHRWAAPPSTFAACDLDWVNRPSDVSVVSARCALIERLLFVRRAASGASKEGRQVRLENSTNCMKLRDFWPLQWSRTQIGPQFQWDGKHPKIRRSGVPSTFRVSARNPLKALRSPHDPRRRGGIMLPNHSPLKVAELFRVLHALFPGRIDLGLGRAAGTDPRTAVALRGSRHALAVDDFPEQMTELLRYLEDDATPRSAFTTSIRAIPLGVPAPVLWILGSTDHGASYAAAHGYGFAFAHHINPDDAIHALRTYRTHFRPSARLAEPQTILAVSALCTETEHDARELEASANLAILRFAGGMRDLPMPSVAEAHAHAWDDDERALLEANRGRMFVGTPGHVRHWVLGLAREALVDEIMIMSNIHDHRARKRSYELLASALR